MLRNLHMNNFRSAWNHYKQNTFYYTFDDNEHIEFRYEDNNNGETNIIINYVQTTNNVVFHDLLRTMIDNLLNNDEDETSGSNFKTIIIKGYATNYEGLGLDLFRYKNKVFEIDDRYFVLVDAEDDE